MNEEAIFKWGMDITAVTRGLRSLKSAVGDLKNDVVGRFVDMGKELAGALVVGSAVEVLHKLGEKVEQIKTKSVELGASTDFVQGLGFAFGQVGLNAEKAFKGMDRLMVAVGKARDEGKGDLFGIELTNVNGTLRNTESIFYAIADKMRDIQDPAERARLALELFGKSGVEMLPALTRGSEELRKMADEAHKLSEENIIAVEEATQRLKAIGNNTLVWVGQFADKIVYAAKFWQSILHGNDIGKTTIELDHEERKTQQLKEYQQQQALGEKEAARKMKEEAALNEESVRMQEAQLKLAFVNAGAEGKLLEALQLRDIAAKKLRDSTGTEVEKAKLAVEIVNRQVAVEQAKARLKKEANDAETKALKDHSDEMDRQSKILYRIHDGQTKNMKAQEALSQGFKEREKVTLLELESDADSKLSQYGRKANLTDFEITALDIRDIEKEMHLADKLGNFSYADSLNKRSLELRRSLGDVIGASEADPMKTLSDAAESTASDISDLLDLANGSGVNINLKTQK